MRKNRNGVRLVGFYGSDMIHAMCAWTIHESTLSADKRQQIPSFLKSLVAKENYSSFERSLLHFIVTTDIATHIRIIKPGAMNGVSIVSESPRYHKLIPGKEEWYVPVDWYAEEKEQFNDFARIAYDNYYSALRSLRERGMDELRARETARFYLPATHQINADISFNFKSFIEFQKLRNTEDARVEVSGIAKEMLRLVHLTGAFDYSLSAFGYGK